MKEKLLYYARYIGYVFALPLKKVRTLPLWIKVVTITVIVFGTAAVITYKPILSRINPPEFYIGDNPKTYEDAYGIQRPIDTTIQKASGQYSFRNVTNSFESHFKNDPTLDAAVKFTNGVSELVFSTLKEQSFGTLQKSTQTIGGNVLTYQNIFNEMDLRYSVHPAQLLEEFVVHSRETALQVATIEQRMTVKNITGYAVEDGAIFLKNGDRTPIVIPKPVLYEFDDTSKRSYGIEYEIAVRSHNEYTITKIITEEGKQWLSDPKRVYPIVIDTSIDNADASGNWVSSDGTNTAVSQETTIKQEGTGSVKIQTTAGVPVNVDLMEYSTDANAQAAYVTNWTLPTGGTITSSGTDRIHSFTSSGIFATSDNISAQVLVVAGGGGGGQTVTTGTGTRVAGGGGAGGVVYQASQAVSSGNTSVTVGGGGATDQNGSDSVFGNITATGGGAGGHAPSDGGSVGGSGGGGSEDAGGAAGTAGQGNSGGSGSGSDGGGGGGGGGATGGNASGSTAGLGGDGSANSITGASVYYGGGGGGGGTSGTGAGGQGGGGTGGTGTGANGTANTGGGGGGSERSGAAGTTNGGTGGSGIVIVRYPALLQAYSDSTTKTEGSYSLKGYALATSSLNKILTRTVSPTLNLSGNSTLSFDIRASRTGSNIKIGIHDSGGTTTETTPNITSADQFQTVNWDISGVSNANKDAVDQIIITIVNADATNTFYIDNMVSGGPSSYDDTVTLTTSAIDMSTATSISYWVYSSQTGSFSRFEFGESASSEQTNAITINQANTWEQKTWDISGIAASAKNAVTKFAFRFTSNTSGAAFYIDDIQSVIPPVAPTIGTPIVQSPGVIRWVFTDNASGETGFKVYDTNNNLVATCATPNLTYCDESGLTANTQYTRKVVAYNAEGNSSYSSTAVATTLASGVIPISGNYIYTSTTRNTDTFTTRYVDGNNASRYVLGVDNGGSPNTAVFEVQSNGQILTINANDTLVVGSLVLTQGSVAIATGGQIVIGQPICSIDADSDGYSADAKLYYGSNPPANCRRKNLFTSLAANDCNDSTYSANNSCTASLTGDGHDGDPGTISTSKNINTDVIKSGRSYADGIAYKVSAIGTNTVTTVDTPNGIAASDEVFLINLQGGSSTYTNVGQYEHFLVGSINGSTITFQSNVVNTYGNSSNSDLTGQYIVIQRVPNYTNLTIGSGGTITASAWDALTTTPTGTAGYRTGIVAFKTSGTFTLSGGSVTVSGLGYRGGAAPGTNTTTPSGESFCGSSAGLGGFLDTSNGTAGSCGGGGGSGKTDNTGSNASGSSTGGGGGGGGNCYTSSNYRYGGGGGGGGYGGAGGGGPDNNSPDPDYSGTAGGTNTSGTGNGGGNFKDIDLVRQYHCGSGGGGGTYGVANLSKLYFGAAGGAGGGGVIYNGNATVGKAGGNGGGVIIIQGSTISISSGSISANGASGVAASTSGGGVTGGGGGGAGGSIRIYGTNVSLGSGLVTATAGSVVNRGGTAGTGRIAAPSGSSGTTNPTYTGI